MQGKFSFRFLKFLDDQLFTPFEQIVDAKKYNSIKKKVNKQYSLHNQNHALTGNLILHLPEVNIKNSNGREHLITDLYLILQIYDYDDNTGNPNYGDGKRVRMGLAGERGSVSSYELGANYLHSHLHSDKPRVRNDFRYPAGNGSYFCLGDNPIRKKFSNEGFKITEGTDTDWFMHLLLQMETSVAWESLEGSPYISMSTIRNRSPNTSFSPSVNVKIGVISNIIKNSTFVGEDITFYSDPDGLLQVSLTDSGEKKMILEIQGRLTDQQPVRDGLSLCLRDIQGTYYPVPVEDSRKIGRAHV